MKEPKIDIWIKAGYKILGTEGLESVKVERLAHSLDLNKSGFYYYFGSMDGFIKSLIQYHINLAETIGEEISRCKVIDPELLQLIVRHRMFFLVESQLIVKGKPLLSSGDIDKAGRILSKEFLLLWRKTGRLPEEYTVALAYLNILRMFFYSRINPNNINYKFLHQLVSETKDVLNKVAEGNSDYLEQMKSQV